jgi:hypothetical protein
LSGQDLHPEIGFHAHFAGLDTKGKVQFYLSADDGKAYFAGGNIVADAKGISSPARQILFRMGSDNSRLYGYGALWGQRDTGLNVFGQFNIDLDTLMHSDDFEDGTFDAWTQTGTPTIESDGPNGLYCAKVNSTNYISVNVSTIIGRQYFVLLSLRTDEAAAPRVAGWALEATTAWGQAVVCFVASSTDTTVEIKSSSASYMLYDDISIYRSADNYSVVGSVLDGEGVLQLEAGAYVNVQGASSIGQVLNAAGLNADTVIYGTTDHGTTDVVYYDASAGSLGIGTEAPSSDYKLDVAGALNTESLYLGGAQIVPGTWTPTLTGVTNVASTDCVAYECLFTRMGDTLMGSGLLECNPTAIGNVTVGISLPIASDFTATNDCSGNATSPGATPIVGSIIPDTVNNRAELRFYSPDAANAFIRFMFVCRIL